MSDRVPGESALSCTRNSYAERRQHRWREAAGAVSYGLLVVACGVAWAVEAVLTIRHSDGYSLRVEDAGNRAGLAMLFLLLLALAPALALVMYLLVRWRWRRIVAAGVLVAMTIAWAAVLVVHIRTHHCLDVDAVC